MQIKINKQLKSCYIIYLCSDKERYMMGLNYEGINQAESRPSKSS